MSIPRSDNNNSGSKMNDRLSPSTQLGGDVLCEIFYACAIADEPSRRDLAWIRLSFVNRLWRSTLLDLPSLWARVICVYPKAIETMLSRARKAPINLDLVPLRHRGRPTYNIDTLNLGDLITRAHTVRDAVNEDRGIIWQTLLRGNVLPLLQCLYLRVQAISSRSLPTHASSRLDTANMLDTPNLREVSLSNIFIPIRAQNLRTMELSEWNCDRQDFVASIDALAGYLRGFPSLQSLSLLDFYDSYDLLSPIGDGWMSVDRSRTMWSAVELPRLRRLRLRSTPFLLSILCRMLATPRVHLVCEFTRLTQAGVLIDALRPFFDVEENNTLTLMPEIRERSTVLACCLGPEEVQYTGVNDIDEGLEAIPGCCVLLYKHIGDVKYTPLLIHVCEALSEAKSPIETLRAVDGGQKRCASTSLDSPARYELCGLFTYYGLCLSSVNRVELIADRPTRDDMRELLHVLGSYESERNGRPLEKLVVRGLPIEWVNNERLRQREYDAFKRHVAYVEFE